MAYAAAIEEKLEEQEFQREAIWTESLAVGGQEFAQLTGRRIPKRMQVIVEPWSPGGNQWVVREERAAYGAENTQETSSIAGITAPSSGISH